MIKIDRLVFIIMGVLFLVACQNNKENMSNTDARDLFNESTLLIIDYIDKLEAASDSVKVDSISEAFEKSITDLNFNYPPNTDLKINEQENDSLFKLLTQFKDLKLKKYQELKITVPDTISIFENS